MTFRRELFALTLCVLAFGMLVLANELPFIVMRQFGRQYDYTILGGIVELFRQRNIVLGTVIFVFSFVFPFVKLLMVAGGASLIPVFPLAVRRQLLASARSLARFSMLDVFVAAVMVVVVKTGDTLMLHSIMDVNVGSGTIVFCSAVFLSGAAAACMPEAGGDDDAASKAIVQAIQGPRWNRHAHRLGIAVGVFALALGAVILLVGPSAENAALVKAIRLTAKPGIELRLLPPHKWDLFLELTTSHGLLRTRTENQAIIGNGITFPLTPPVQFRDIASIAAWDARKSTIWDRMHDPERLDRVDEIGMETVGDRFCFLMVADRSWNSKRGAQIVVASVFVGTGTLLLLYFTVAFLRRHPFRGMVRLASTCEAPRG